ncbi:carboxypeptidase Q-like isoform X2 [Neocloeon triangulifer]|uniref:carboxypeptidase Q-like isoform X2 n=1 Tax=Neocloeon triangulifer TaxID=2078957 RepID=UPI00286F7BC8|nr:carboxypeptidase Q-like isoform X2 [Neocloeon triangulifer]
MVHIDKIIIFFPLLLATQVWGAAVTFSENDIAAPTRQDFCKQNLSPQVVNEIQSYAPIARKIIKFVTEGKYKGRTWTKLAEFVDKFGSRIAGSKNLENAIDFMLDELKKEGLENVHGEEAQVPHWVRGKEHAELIEPRKQNLPILGLGSSVATPKSGITAELLVVDSFDELQRNKNLASGKIVVFNENYTSYGDSVQYRDYAAVEAAKLGGVATLVRSVTPFSISSPHTGWQDYDANVTKIPTASITVEDAEMLSRMFKRGDKLKVRLYMEAQNLPPATSRNTVAEIRGKTNPEEVVVVSGHLDSWDVGQGAMDDGGGAFVSWVSLAAIKKLGLTPRRTLRAILWTAEEEGLVGAFAYVKAHKSDQGKLDFVMESDEGTFTPHGLSFSGSKMGGCILQEILKLTASINTTNYETPQDGGPDIKLWTSKGVPGASLINSNERYFWFHHSAGDMMTVEDPRALDLCTALWAVASYVVADLSFTIPRQ